MKSKIQNGFKTNIKNYFLVLIGIIVLTMSGFVAEAQTNGRSIQVKYITDPIHLDGILDEPIWQTADVIIDFWQFFPTDSTKSVNPTEIRLLYDDHAIYIGVKAEVKSNNYVVASLRRDFYFRGRCKSGHRKQHEPRYYHKSRLLEC